MTGSAPAFWTKQQKHWKSLSVVDVKKPVQENAHATRGALCAHPDANVQENVTSCQVLLKHQLATNTIEHKPPLYIIN